MKINLYIDNDSRPRGSYENCRSALIQPSKLTFVTSSGKHFATNLRYLIEVEDGDTYTPVGPITAGCADIAGRPKPKASRTESRRQADLNWEICICKHLAQDHDSDGTCHIDGCTCPEYKGAGKG